GLVAFASSLDQIGPFAHTVADAARVAQALCGWDAQDATSAQQPVPDFEAALGEDVRGLRIGVPWPFLETGVDAGVMERFRKALAAFESAGARLVDVTL